MTNGGGKHPKKKAPKKAAKSGKKSAAALSRPKLTGGLPKPEKPAS
jgi:hypothetical protein